MSKALLCISIFFFFILVTLHSIAAKPAHKRTPSFRKIYTIASTIRSNLGTYTSLTKYEYNPYENQIGLKTNTETPIRYHSDLQPMLKKLQKTYRRPVGGKPNPKISKSINTPRCGIEDNSLTYNLARPW